MVKPDYPKSGIMSKFENLELLFKCGESGIIAQIKLHINIKLQSKIK